MNFLFIFALFLFAHSDEKLIHSRCKEVIFPDAGPVQFWLTDCNTYNESIPNGVHYKCFCAPWKCNDEIKIQFRDYFDSSELVPVENQIPFDLPPLEDWISIPGTGDEPWTTGAAPAVDLGGFPLEDSEYIVADYNFIEGTEYTISLDYFVDIGLDPPINPNSGRLMILDDDNNILFQNTQTSTGSRTVTLTFTATASSSRVGFRFLTGNDNVTTTINSRSSTYTEITYTYPDPKDYELVIYNEEDEVIDRAAFDSLIFIDGLFYLFSLSIVPSDYGICEEQIRFEVDNLSSSPDVSVAKSDCLNVTESEANPTVLIGYSSNKNFNGLVFENISPDQMFYLRIPAIFFHERHPQEDEVARLSSSVIKLNSSITDQKQIETDFIPYYFHKKIELVLMMPTLLIDDEYWTKQEGYSIEDGSKRWPVKRATCWLTKRDTLQRQVI